MRRRVLIVDVFADQPLRGNPVAVVLDANGLTDSAMQQIAAWTNLSETTFCLPATQPDADYRLRIFTPCNELPFAGHPTLGSLHALLSDSLLEDKTSYVQQCAAGQVSLRVDAEGYRFCLPRAKIESIDQEVQSRLSMALGLSSWFSMPELIDVGPRWIVARIEDRRRLAQICPDFSALAALERRIGATGVTLYADDPDGGAAGIQVRSFAPSQGVPEDPVCGSGNGAVAIYRQQNERLPTKLRYVARQGTNVGREGRVHVELTGEGEIWIGGRCVTTVEGVLDCD